jgi:two-component system, OmpR family, heavy metal sensor histidine kinase CusS
MSSNRAPSRRSLSLQLTLWFGLSSVLVTAVVIGVIYWTLAAFLGDEIDCALREEAAQFHPRRDELLAKLDREWLADAALRIVGPDGGVRFDAGTLTAAQYPTDGFADLATADGKDYRAYAVTMDGWLYQVALDRTQERAVVAQLRRRILFATVPTLVVSLIVAWLLTRRGLRPMHRITDAVAAVTADHLDRRIATERLPSELATMADTLNGMLARMQDSFRRLDQFSADIAHELRTPVHNLRVVAEVAIARERSGDEYRQALAAAIEEADRLTRLIDRLLLLARVSDPKAEVALEPVDISAELRALAEFFEPAASQASVRLVTDVAGALPGRVDRPLFQRAVSNLLTNALAHTPPDGRIDLTASRVDSDWFVRVQDTGCGIPAADLPRLFDRFHRSERAKAIGRGVGIGLAIVKRVVELHGGAIDVASRVGVGTTVTLRLPARDA